MRPEELREVLNVKPFVPIRIFFSDGKYYDIRHPEQVMLSRSVVDIGITKRNHNGIMDKIVRCSLLHVVRVEPAGRIKAAS